MKLIALVLWCLAGVPWIFSVAAQTPGLTEVSKAADLAREKDIVWLALVMAIVAIGFSAWLVSVLVNITKSIQLAMLRNAEVHSENARAVSAVANSVDDLRRELERRPCMMPPPARQ